MTLRDIGLQLAALFGEALGELFDPQQEVAADDELLGEVETMAGHHHELSDLLVHIDDTVFTEDGQPRTVEQWIDDGAQRLYGAIQAMAC